MNDNDEADFPNVFPPEFRAARAKIANAVAALGGGSVDSILHRFATQPARTAALDAVEATSNIDVSPSVAIAAMMRYATTLYGDRIDFVEIIDLASVAVARRIVERENKKGGLS